MFTRLNQLPTGFLTANAANLHQLLPTPSIIYLQGRQEPPVFISILLHGNEDVGLKALQQVLKHYTEKRLPRSLIIFCGNTLAASQGLRHLDQQPDFNRIWPGTEQADCTETRLAAAIVAEMKSQNLFASIDLHNNTGLNPHYACINRLDHRSLNLARLFSRTVVFFQRPLGVQSMAFAQLCPSVTLECGKAGSTEGVNHAARLLDAVMNLQQFPTQAPNSNDIDLFHTVGIVKIPNSVNFSFTDPIADVLFDSQLDHLNFCELPAGFEFARLKRTQSMPDIIGEHGEQLSHRYFEVIDGKLRLKRQVMPSMLTLDERVIRQDCLCYFMERLAWPEITAEPPVLPNPL